MQYLWSSLAIAFLAAGIWSTFASLNPAHNLRQILWPELLKLPDGPGVVGCIETAQCASELKVHWKRALVLEGWAAFIQPGSRLQQLDFLIDGKKIAQVHDFLPRPDVAAAFDRPDFTHSAWIATLPLTGISPGKHTLTVQATSSSGARGVLPALILDVQ